MSVAGGLVRFGSLDDECVTWDVVRACYALELARELLPSKPVVARAFDRGKLLLGSRPLARGDALRPGDVVTLELESPAGEVPLSDGPLVVVYQDRLLMAVDKPAGLLVHGDGTGVDTLTARANGLLARQGVPAVAQPVQRLDVETTGLTLLSLSPEFQPALDAQVAGHDMRKRYLALVEGPCRGLGEGWLELDSPIGRDRHDARRMRVARGGKPALTRIRLVGRSGGRSLLLVELGSGRRHQIRVHLSHAGMPIVGDGLYGGARHSDGLMLHAWEESLVHPASGEQLVVRTAWPERFARAGFVEAEAAFV